MTTLKQHRNYRGINQYPVTLTLSPNQPCMNKADKPEHARQFDDSRCAQPHPRQDVLIVVLIHIYLGFGSCDPLHIIH